MSRTGEGREKFGWVTARPRSDQDAVNRRIYGSSLLVLTYARRKLKPAEVTVFARFADEFESARILELGCGAGRITRHLIERSASVVGIDVSPAMIDYCKWRISGATFAVRDLRDLSLYEDASFDVVVGGANVLDAVSHEDRLGALRDIRRLLVPGGLLYFSSHNRNSSAALADARRGPRLRLTKNPYRLARRAVTYLEGRRNYPRLSKLQRFEDEYALLNDEGHGWGLLHYYIDRAAQERQLAATEFERLEVIAPDGRVLEPGDADAAYTELHYVARSR